MEMAPGSPSRRLKLKGAVEVCDVNKGEEEKKKNFISLNVRVNLLSPKIMLVQRSALQVA